MNSQELIKTFKIAQTFLSVKGEQLSMNACVQQTDHSKHMFNIQIHLNNLKQII